MLENGTIIDGKYKILNKIGQGGMSVVYLAMNEKANKQWAIKEVRKDVTKNFEVIKQGLITETNLLKKLDHPNLPSIVDIIDAKDTFLIVMDYIEGVPLSARIEDTGAQDQEQVIDIALQLCDVLQYLHTREKPIIYRDMKPGNVMLKPNGDVILIDFGIAREYKSQNIADTTCLGTQGYAAPEQFGGQGQTDERTDIYCLGATLYHLLTNHNPGEPPYEMYPIRRWNQELSTGLEEIILKCTQRNPKDRYQNCNELRYALEHYVEHDIAYRRKENKRFLQFCGLATATFFALIGAITLQVYANSMKNNNYEAYLQNANSEFDKERATNLYLQAIDLDGARQEAYMSLLESFLEDDNFEESESVVIRQLLQADNGLTTNYEEQLKGNIPAYEEISYQLALAYFYSYDNAGNKNSAKKWLQIASNATTLDPIKVQRAQKLLKISEYYSKIGVQSKSGDEAVSYKDYFEDLLELSTGNMVETDNAVTALMMYNELSFQIATNEAKFQHSGVSKQEMVTALQDIISHIETDISAIDMEKERVVILINRVRENILVAQKELETNIWVEKKVERTDS